MRPLRVLHVPDSVGGHAPGLARAERELGVESTSVVLRKSPFAYAVDEVVGRPGTSRLAYERGRLRLLARALRDFDVVHFNFGRTLVPGWLGAIDLPLLRRAGKAIFVTFQGDDARRGDIAAQRGGLSLPTALPHLYPARADAERRRRVARFARWAHGIFFLNPDLAHVLPARAEFVPYAHVEPREWAARVAGSAGHVPVLVHAPSDPVVKGTNVVLAAVDALHDSGVETRLELVQGRTHAEARAIYARADLAVDQLYAGWYGGFAVEAMALGVPVVSHIRDEDLDVLPQEMRATLPVLRATPDTLAAVLTDWLTGRRPELAAVGAASRAYVERWHDPKTIARSIVDRYRVALEVLK